VNADYNVAFKNLKLPEDLRRGMILYRGKLTPEYKYLEKYL
jgi:hypothetical protein